MRKRSNPTGMRRIGVLMNLFLVPRQVPELRIAVERIAVAPSVHARTKPMATSPKNSEVAT
jgi:hypothetical protein